VENIPGFLHADLILVDPNPNLHLTAEHAGCFKFTSFSSILIYNQLRLAPAPGESCHWNAEE
jgi:hypothetical protein